MTIPTMQNYVNGEWINSDTEVFGDVFRPATGEKIAQVPYGTASDVDKAVIAAKEAFVEWRETPPMTRARYLFRIKDAFEENFEEDAINTVVMIRNPNAANVIRATIDAFQKMRDPYTVARERKITLDKVFNG